MDDQKRIIDHTALIEAARDDAAREGARIVTLSVSALWQLIQRAPIVIGRTDALAATQKPR